MWDYLLAVAVGIIAYKISKKGAPYYGALYLILSGVGQLFVDAPMIEIRLFLLTAFGLWFFARYNTRQHTNDVNRKPLDEDRSTGR